VDVANYGPSDIMLLWAGCGASFCTIGVAVQATVSSCSIMAMLHQDLCVHPESLHFTLKGDMYTYHV
jgi:hypothetical protein